jgi:mono/diheme cytochrome c family protein
MRIPNLNPITPAKAGLAALFKKPPMAVSHALLACSLAAGLLLAACNKGEAAPKAAAKSEAASGPANGVGPIQSLKLDPLDHALAAKGEKAFSGTCAACHKMDQRYVGPALAGVTKRRTPEWIMNMIMNPVEMTQKDETAKALLAEYMTQMSVSASEEEARAILEYFRKIDG